MKKKHIALLLACVMLMGVAIGGTMAWLTDKSDQVTNIFTMSDITITLSETKGGDAKEFKMVPGHTIEKDPKVAVSDDSEDCWLFVKVMESTTPDLDAYISYAVAEGWEEVEVDAQDDVKVYGRIVNKTDATKEFSILSGDKVTVLGSVTKEMMEAIATTQPTLTFEAAAVQLYEGNDDAFAMDEAYAKVSWAS